ncbi:MAG: SIS domain-containing protein [Cetobacterium sp.]
MKIVKDYLDYAITKIQEVKEKEVGNIEKAVNEIAESCENGGKFYVFGSGHSHIIAEEVYIRAGGFALVKAILPPELMLHEMPNKSTYLERLEGYAEAILKLNKVDSNDTIMIVSNSGRNSVPVEMCIESKKIGCKVIALTSLKHSQNTTSRHSSGKKMYEVADITIDNCAEKGDAAFYVDNFDTPVGPTSDLTGIAIAQAIIAGVVDKLVKKGITPPVFKSSNLDNADEYNEVLFDKYYSSIK